MRDNNHDTVNATFEVAVGFAAITVAGFAAAILFPVAEPAARVLLVGVTVGVLAAVFSDWRACAAVAIIAALVYVGFLAHQDGVLTGDAMPWSFTPLIGCAALLGRGYRRITHPTVHEPALPTASQARRGWAAGGDHRHVGTAVQKYPNGVNW